MVQVLKGRSGPPKKFMKNWRRIARYKEYHITSGQEGSAVLKAVHVGLERELAEGTKSRTGRKPCYVKVEGYYEGLYSIL
jgi:hypothetical protein